MPDEEKKLAALDNMLNAVVSHTSSKGQFILKSRLIALQNDWELLKTLLNDTSIHLGKCFTVVCIC